MCQAITKIDIDLVSIWNSYISTILKKNRTRISHENATENVACNV